MRRPEAVAVGAGHTARAEAIRAGLKALQAEVEHDIGIRVPWLLLPAARQLAWLLVKPLAALDATAAAVVSRVAVYRPGVRLRSAWPATRRHPPRARG